MSCSDARSIRVKSPIDVVIVDDAGEIRSLLGVYFSLDPRVMVVAEGESGVEAVALAQRQQPSIMILDVMMPGVSGLDALPLIKRASPGTKVIMYSAQTAAATRKAAAEAGADAYIEKSASLAELSDLVIDLASGDVGCP